MQIDRRTMLAGSAALLASARRWRNGARRHAGWYDQAIIIDALGGVGDPYAPEEQLRLSDRAWAEMVATGVTLLRDTVMPVGNVADPWGDYQKDVALKQNILNANPDRLLLVRSAADILKAKREKKFAVVLGTQDTSMVGPELDRLAQMKKDGVMTVQLTYNNRNLAGDGALEPANAGLSKLGRATIERIEAEKLLLDLSHGGARTMAEAAAHAKRPLVISHTGARALTDHPRNTADETIKAVADKGGVVGVYFMPFLTRRQPSQGRGPDRPCRACRESRRRGPCRHRHRQWRAADDARRGDQGARWRSGSASGSRPGSPRRARRSASIRWSRIITASTATGGSWRTWRSAAGARRGWRS